MPDVAPRLGKKDVVRRSEPAMDRSMSEVSVPFSVIGKPENQRSLPGQPVKDVL